MRGNQLIRGGCQMKEEKPGRVLSAGNVGLGTKDISLCCKEMPASGIMKP